MNINISEKADGTNFVDLEFEPDEVNKQRRDTFNRIRNSIQIDGFRKGKINYKTFQKMFGTKIIEDALLDDIVNDAFYSYIQENEIHPLSQPNMTEYEFDDEGGLTATISFALAPSLEIPDLDDVIEKVDDLTLDLEHIEDLYDEEIKDTLIDFYQTEPADHDEVQEDDYVELSVTDTNDWEYVPEKIKLVVGRQNSFIDSELSKKLIGKKRGKFTRLKDGDRFYTVRIEDIYKGEAPEITEDFVKETFGFDSVDEFNQFIHPLLQKNIITKKSYENGEKIYSSMLDMTTGEVSPLYIDQLKEDYVNIAEDLPKYNYNFSEHNSIEENLKRLIVEEQILSSFPSTRSQEENMFTTYLLINIDSKINEFLLENPGDYSILSLLKNNIDRLEAQQLLGYTNLFSLNNNQVKND